MQIRKTEADGNCMFRCIAYLVFHDEKRHAEVRKACTDEIRLHPNRYRLFVIPEKNNPT